MGLRDTISNLSPNEFLAKMQDMFQMYQESQDDYYEEAKYLDNEQIEKYKKATAQLIRILEKVSLQKSGHQAAYPWYINNSKVPTLEKLMKRPSAALSPNELMDLTIEFVNQIGMQYLHRPLNNIK